MRRNLVARAWLRHGLVALAAGCAPNHAPPTAPVRTLVAHEAKSSEASAPAPSPQPSEAERAIAEVLAAVGKRHSLGVLRTVPGKVVDRDEAIRLIMLKTERDVPRHVLEAQGEMFASLGIAPADYRFVDGMFAMVKKNIAGFYDPDDDTMYLLDDLDDEGREQTLAHELVHALQDQHFDLGGRLDYRRGKLDELAAQSCLAEGDATSAMFEGPGVPHKPSPDEVGFMMAASVALTEGGAATPRALQSSLIAPYVDGYRFVEELRARGGWAEVNRVWKRPPISTEQVLHVDRYDAREQPIDVPEPTAATLGSGWTLVDADVAGEQGLRIVLEQWTTRGEAATAAEGWGGDRYAVFTRAGEPREWAMAWRITFDDAKEAKHAAIVVAKQLLPCSERDALGPIGWQHKDATVIFAAGPYARTADGKAKKLSSASCRLTSKWLAELVR